MSPQSQAVALPKRFPLVTQLDNRDATTNKDTRLVNCYAEKHEEGDYTVEKRPGLSAPIYTYPGIGLGVYLWNYSIPAGNYAFLVIATAQTAFININVISLLNGQVFNAGSFISLFGPTNIVQIIRQYVALFTNTLQFCAIPGSSPYLVFSTGNGAAYIGGVAGLTVTPISDPTYPVYACPGLVYLDGTLYVMDFTGNIFGSKFLNDPRTWDPLNVIVAQAEPDGGVYLAKQLTYVIAIKQWTTQVFYDAGNATGSPLGPVPGALLYYGCRSPDTVQSIEGILFWVTASRTASPQVIRFENLQPQIISTPAIDRLLANASINGLLTNFQSFWFKRGGHRFYIFSAIDANVTLVYDLDQHLWYQWTDANGNYWPIVSAAYDLSGNTLGQDIDDGFIYQIDMDYVFPNDNGAVVPVDIYTPNFDGGTDRRKQLNMMYFSADQVAGSVLQARYSDNDYKSWTNFRSIDLNFERPYLDQEGTFVKRAYHFRHRANTPFRVRSVGLQLDVGTL